MISNRCKIKYSLPFPNPHDAKCFPDKIAEQIHRYAQQHNIRKENRVSKSKNRSQKSINFLKNRLYYLIENWLSQAWFWVWVIKRFIDHIKREKCEVLRWRNRFNSHFTILCLHQPCKSHVPLWRSTPINSYVNEICAFWLEDWEKPKQLTQYRKKEKSRHCHMENFQKHV